MSSLAAALRVLRAEGGRAFWDRLRDHRSAARRRRSYQPVEAAALPAVAVLQLTPVPPLPWLGGVPAALAARRDAAEAPSALAYPWRGGVRVEVDAGARRVAAWLPAVGAAAGGEPGAILLAALPALRSAVRARLVHVEGVAGLPLAPLVAAAREVPLVLAVHDFALVCPRPNLFDPLAGAACGGCATAEACRLRLGAGGDPGAAQAGEWRATGGTLLAAARCVVYPSAYLRGEHHRLLRAVTEERVVAPAVLGGAAASPWRGAAPRGWRPRVAAPGAGSPHKGSAALAALVAAWGERAGVPPVAWEVLGGGHPQALASLRRLPGVRVRGYYRAGTLPQHLCGGADLTLVLSAVPETYSLVVSESLAAGVPVLGWAQGALPERLAGGGGLLVPPAAGVVGVAAAIERWLVGREPIAPPSASPPIAVDAARAWAALHEDLLRR